MEARGGAEAEGMRLKAQAFSQYGEVNIHIQHCNAFTKLQQHITGSDNGHGFGLLAWNCS